MKTEQFRFNSNIKIKDILQKILHNYFYLILKVAAVQLILYGKLSHKYRFSLRVRPTRK